jgi:hypothetical protein
MEDLLDRLMADRAGSDDFAHSRIGQEELDSQKAAAREGSLSLTRRSTSDIPRTTVPAVKPPGESRRGRKMAEEEQARQWRMEQATRRALAAINSVMVVTAHAQRQLDRAQAVMADRFYGVKRRAVMNEFMGEVTSRLVRITEAGVIAIVESHPKRIAEEL